MRTLLVFSGPLLFLSGSVLANAATTTGTASSSQSSLVGQLVQLGLGMILVVGLIFLMGYLLRRVGPLAPQGGQHIKLVSSLPMGPRDRLLLVDVGGKQLLIGVSPGRINTLHVFDEPVADVTAERGVTGDFAQKLQAMLKRENKP
ncbi:MAG TPA: flagellar biosynthetic protein FliO [Pseudomonas xinjiangensis]|uniref:Flagellar protein n=2 Tax=root TaxID=1 RepID=A0A7V1BNK4_9GAMM|nr:flagellar biosynthetic protein FliO [Halopseudomonas xinjiangensis]HEC49128.1 flagellar biosynthetic protein FliO [Halopseudomonas xinjiangensis]